ncbi:MAG: hypothetical protein MUF04_14545, partial [Akkermansiaceae bacterium]|nr:hypothetical protein [Akkermansiaceae bacterium]
MPKAGGGVLLVGIEVVPMKPGADAEFVPVAPGPGVELKPGVRAFGWREHPHGTRRAQRVVVHEMLGAVVIEAASQRTDAVFAVELE